MTPTFRSALPRKAVKAAGACALAAAMLGVPAAAVGASTAGGSSAAERGPDGLGIKPGKIKHVWLIILENKSYDATFTGLNNNTYLWKTLPAQGVLLKNYYGTGHFSLDNYTSMVSGQATQQDLQADCPFYDTSSGSIDLSGSLHRNPELRAVRLRRRARTRPPARTGACTRQRCRRLFNQFDAAKVSWKGYAQDLGNADASGPAHSAGAQFCGAPYGPPGVTGSTADVNPGSANATDQYVPKHFPFPWFDSMLKSGDCAARASRTCSARQPGSTMTCRASRRRRPSAGSRRTTAATRTTRSATATTCPAASPTRTPRTRR